nr:hypothetical protein [Tanacetum cinerariifolium]
MPMDPLDPYVQLVMEVRPSPDYIPGPKVPPSPDYIPGPEAPPLPDYIPGPEYLPQADDVLPDEEQPLPAAVSPTVESPRYITDSEPEMKPEEEDGDDKKFEGDSIEYPTSRGDDDAVDDGDDLSKDDADEEDSSDSEEEEEEHLTLTVPAPALHSSIPASEDSDETEPFEEGKTIATPPPFGYRITARISVQPHILISFHSKSKVERLLAIPTPPLSLVSLTSYPLPPFLRPLPIFTPLQPPPLIILPRTRASMVLMRSTASSTFILAPRLRTLPIGTPSMLPIPLPTSSFPLPLLLPSTSGSESTPEADMPLRKRARFTTPTGGYEVGESSVAATTRHSRLALTVADNRRAEDRLIGRLRRERRYFRTLSTTMRMSTTTAIEPMTQEAINNLIAQRVTKSLAEYETQRNSVVNGDTSHTTGIGPRTMHPTRECTYKDYLNCRPLKFNGTEGVVGSGEKSYIGTKPLCPKCNFYHDGPCRLKCTNCKRTGHIARDCRNRAANTNNNNNNNYNNQRTTSAYQGVPTCFECGAQGHYNNNCSRLENRNQRNRNQGNQNQAGNGNVVAREYGLGTAGGNPNANVVTGTFLLNNHCASILFDTGADKTIAPTIAP